LTKSKGPTNSQKINFEYAYALKWYPFDFFITLVSKGKTISFHGNSAAIRGASNLVDRIGQQSTNQKVWYQICSISRIFAVGEKSRQGVAAPKHKHRPDEDVEASQCASAKIFRTEFRCGLNSTLRFVLYVKKHHHILVAASWTA